MVAIWFSLWVFILHSPAITSGRHINLYGVLLGIAAFADLMPRMRR